MKAKTSLKIAIVINVIGALASLVLIFTGVKQNNAKALEGLFLLIGNLGFLTLNVSNLVRS